MMYHSEPYAKIYQGDSRHMELLDKSVHMVCTSPPYWGLRKYDSQSSDAFGSEPTPELYVAHTLEFLAEIWRVLRDDGVLYLNCGDSMYSAGARHDAYDDTINKEVLDLKVNDLPSENPCGECANILLSYNLGKHNYPSPKSPALGGQSSHSHNGLLTDHQESLHLAFQVDRNEVEISGLCSSQGFVDEPIRGVQESTSLLSSEQLPGECSQKGSYSFAPKSLLSFFPYVPQCEDRMVCPFWKHLTSLGIQGLPGLVNNKNDTEEIDGTLGDHTLDRTCVSYPYSTRKSRHNQIKPLDMCLIPQQVAIAARAQGWYVRSWVIWEKSNPMPESIGGWRWEKHKIKVGNRGRGKEAWRAGANETPQQDHAPDGSFQSSVVWQDCPGCLKCLPNDGLVLRRGAWRPTDSVDYILMMTKTDKYYGDREAVLEPYTKPLDRWGGDILVAKGESDWSVETGQPAYRDRNLRPNPNGRNLRNVWRFPTQSAGFEHYAAFPQRLPEICIQASTSEYGVCAGCGAPYARVVENKPMKIRRTDWGEKAGNRTASSGTMVEPNETVTFGWRKTCRCQANEIAPAVVLDPFCGTGTTLYVAKKLGRIGIGYDLSAKYCAMSKKRVSKVEPTRRMVY